MTFYDPSLESTSRTYGQLPKARDADGYFRLGFSPLSSAGPSGFVRQTSAVKRGVSTSGLLASIGLVAFVIGFVSVFFAATQPLLVLAPIGAVVWMVAGSMRSLEDANDAGR